MKMVKTSRARSGLAGPGSGGPTRSVIICKPPDPTGPVRIRKVPDQPYITLNGNYTLGRSLIYSCRYFREKLIFYFHVIICLLSVMLRQGWELRFSLKKLTPLYYLFVVLANCFVVYTVCCGPAPSSPVPLIVFPVP